MDIGLDENWKLDDGDETDRDPRLGMGRSLKDREFVGVEVELESVDDWDDETDESGDGERGESEMGSILDTERERRTPRGGLQM